MAKTYRNLWPQFISWDNLLLAYSKCRRRKRYRRHATEFDFAWEANLLQLQQDLVRNAYQPGPYRHFYIFEPKKRRISAAPFRDRVVHHAIVNVLEPIYERRFISDSYACRKGKGTHRAIKRAHRYLQRYPYYLKTDIVRFFPNVNHEHLIQQVATMIRDPRILDLITQIVDSGAGVLRNEATTAFFPGDDLFDLLRPKGLPIGNLTSQFLANVLLDPLDHFIKEALSVPGYVRYADDLALFGNSKQELWTAAAEIREQLAQMRLRLHRDKTQLRPRGAGLKFLGLVLRPGGIRLQQSGIARFNRRLRRLRWAYRHGFITSQEIKASLQAWIAHASHANSVGIRRELWRRVRFVKSPVRP